ncbi:hypothetical protein FQA39_LY01399 [Lamprigera yunnana]|nr:hypothetical protein FQA39_LY01399 [Lamprigera yunnana]
MASNIPDISYCCEICGMEGLTEDELRIHTNSAHVEGQGVCPFCQLSAISSAELLVHVNEAHLDYLTPDTENMGFIDDASPSDYSCMNGGNTMISSISNQKFNNINLKLLSKTTLNGDVSPSESSHGEGSPLRSSLNLKLRNPVSILQCPMCKYTSISPDELEEHINRQHFDLTSPSLGGCAEEIFSCPLCYKDFNSAPDLELHVNIEHKDILSPASSNSVTCPLCGVIFNSDNNSEEAVRHVESHFPAGSPLQVDKATLREREQREFELLRAQYGMDNQGNFREQSVTNMQRAVYAGEMSVSDYYERTLDLRAAESCGIDDSSSVTRNLVPHIRSFSNNSQNIVRTLTCTCVDHYASSYGDRGWGCGYRNAQMLISSLLTHTGYNDRLYKLWQDQKPPRSSVPSISRLQNLIEQAWSQGFDIQGSEQLGSRLVNTRKWIGATEVVTLLSFLRIRCQLVDFHEPTGLNGSHPELFNWVLKYFENSIAGEFTPPLYLQHQGHSRTIMGVEVHRDGTIVLLVLDPSHSPTQMGQLLDTSCGMSAMRLLRKNDGSMKARQYEVVAVVGMIDNDQQYQQSKILRGLRIPQNR